MNRLYVVGLGPGAPQYMTAQASQALAESDVICGYSVYTDLVRPLFPEKEFCASSMRKELERCRQALEIAAQGQTVSVVCSGDPGVYGMAAPLLEMSGEYPTVQVTVVPGVTAALSGGACLGAPLGHDFCVISLSDLLTPWEQIEKRLECAASGDFVVCLYNPGSRHRKDHLRRACGVLLRHRRPETVCGWVRNVGREDTQMGILSLGQLVDLQADMFTTVFVGSSATKETEGRMVTPRGYCP